VGLGDSSIGNTIIKSVSDEQEPPCNQVCKKACGDVFFSFSAIVRFWFLLQAVRDYDGSWAADRAADVDGGLPA
jgi:hypothetical protein